MLISLGYQQNRVSEIPNLLVNCTELKNNIQVAIRKYAGWQQAIGMRGWSDQLSMPSTILNFIPFHKPFNVHNTNASFCPIMGLLCTPMEQNNLYYLVAAIIRITIASEADLGTLNTSRQTNVDNKIGSRL